MMFRLLPLSLVAILCVIGVTGCWASKHTVPVNSEVYVQPLLSHGRRAEAKVIVRKKEHGLNPETKFEPIWTDRRTGKKWSIVKVLSKEREVLEKRIPREESWLNVDEVPEWLRLSDSDLSHRSGVASFSRTYCIVSIEPLVVIASDAPISDVLFYMMRDGEIVGQEGDTADRLLLPLGFTYGNMCPWSEKVWVMDEDGEARRLSFQRIGESERVAFWRNLRFEEHDGRIHVQPIPADSKEQIRAEEKG